MEYTMKILGAFLVFCLLRQDAEGAPAKAKGRYMWVRCRPNGKNANCVKEWGPWMSLPGPRDRLPPSAAQDIMKASLDVDLQSIDGSRASRLFAELGSGDQSSTDGGSGNQWAKDWGSGVQSSIDWGSGDQFPWDLQDLGLFTAEGTVQLLEGSELGDSSLEGSGSERRSLEGSGFEGSGHVLDYTDYGFPQSKTPQQNNIPHTLDLQEDNFNL